MENVVGYEMTMLQLSTQEIRSPRLTSIHQNAQLFFFNLSRPLSISSFFSSCPLRLDWHRRRQAAAAAATAAGGGQ